MPKAKRDKGWAVTRFQPYRRCATRPPRFVFFLELPAELRRLVYSFVLLMPDALDVCGIWNDKPRIDVALLRTCRQIHTEAAQYLYSTNTFCFLEHCDAFYSDADSLDENECHTWLRDIGDANARSLRNLQLRVREERAPDYYVRLLGEIAARAPNLTRIALVAEKHASRRQLLHPGHFISRWEPNQVNPLQSLDVLKPSLQLFTSLRVLVLAGRRAKSALERLCALLQCRVQTVDTSLAVRNGDRCTLLWNQKTCYDGFPVGKDEVYSLDAPSDSEAGSGDGDSDDEEDGDDDGISDSGIAL